MKTKEKTVETMATEALKYFVRNTRDNGEAFYILKDDRPEWLYDLTYAAHDGTLPDDFIYNAIHSAISDFADGGTEDDIEQCVDCATSCYTYELTKWLASSVDRVEYLTEALEQFDCKDGVKALARAQYLEIHKVYHIAWTELETALKGA